MLRWILGGVLALAAVVGWLAWEPRVMDAVAGHVDRCDELHAALGRARSELRALEASGETRPPPADLDPRPRRTPEAWNVEYLERARLEDPGLGPGATPDPSAYLEVPSGLPSCLRLCAPGSPARRGEDPRRSESGVRDFLASLGRRYAVVYGAPGVPTGYRSELPCALIDLRSGAVLDRVVVQAGEAGRVTDYTVQAVLQERWRTELERGDTPPWVAQHALRARAAEGPLLLLAGLVCVLVPMALLRRANRAMMKAVSDYGEHYGLEVGAERFLFLRRYPWAEGTVAGRRLSYRTSLTRKAAVGFLEVEASIPARLRGCVRRRAERGPWGLPRVVPCEGTDDPSFRRAFEVEGGAEALLAALDEDARRVLGEHLAGSLRLEADRLVFDRGGTFLGDEDERQRFVAMTDLMVRLAGELKASGE